LADQEVKTDKPIFKTPFGLIVYFSEEEITDSDKRDRFLSFLNLQEIPFYLIKSGDFSLRISQVTERLEKSNNQNLIPLQKTSRSENQKSENLLFFSGFSRNQVEHLLEHIRDENFPRFPLKAVATENNYNFTFNELIHELFQDRIVISHVINLRKRINALIKHLTDYNTLTSEQKDLLQKEIDQAENLLKDVETNFDLKLFRNKIEKFNYILAKLKHEKG